MTDNPPSATGVRLLIASLYHQSAPTDTTSHPVVDDTVVDLLIQLGVSRFRLCSVTRARHCFVADEEAQNLSGDLWSYGGGTPVCY